MVCGFIFSYSKHLWLKSTKQTPLIIDIWICYLDFVQINLQDNFPQSTRVHRQTITQELGKSLGLKMTHRHFYIALKLVMLLSQLSNSKEIRRLYGPVSGIYIFTFFNQGHSRISIALQWRHNECNGISNHQPHDCLLNRLFKVQIKENIKALCHWPLWGEFTGDWWNPCTKGQ